MHHLVHGLLLCLALVLLPHRAHGQAWDFKGRSPYNVRHWSEVLEIITQAERARGNSGEGRFEGDPTIYLSPQGRFVMRPLQEATWTEPDQTWLGRFRRKGNWIELHKEGQALDTDRMGAEHRAAYDAWVAGAKPRVELPGSNLEKSTPMRRFLVVPHQDGELLLDAQAVSRFAAGWEGKGPLHLYPSAWSVSGLDLGEEGQLPDVPIADPLHAALPQELKSLLRPEAIEARVVELLETPSTLKWNHHRAWLPLRLDRGARHGLYGDIDLYGVPPDDNVWVRIKEVHADHVIAERWLHRFSPSDAVEFPSVGQRFSMRRIDQVACVIDTSAALRATIVGAKVPTSGLQWDNEGYAWYEVQIDQGSAQGLALEDVVRPENTSLDGEGRVRALQSDQATVLWRVHRNRIKNNVRIPRPGDVLVTAAWQRVETEVFGEKDAKSVIDNQQGAR